MWNTKSVIIFELSLPFVLNINKIYNIIYIYKLNKKLKINNTNYIYIYIKTSLYFHYKYNGFGSF